MAKKRTIDTDELMTLLFQENSLGQFLQREESTFQLPTFAEYLTNWCKEHQEVPEQVILRANLEKSSKNPSDISSFPESATLPATRSCSWPLPCMPTWHRHRKCCASPEKAHFIPASNGTPSSSIVFTTISVCQIPESSSMISNFRCWEGNTDE